MFDVDVNLVEVYKYFSVYEKSYLIQSQKCLSCNYLPSDITVFQYVNSVLPGSMYFLTISARSKLQLFFPWEFGSLPCPFQIPLQLGYSCDWIQWSNSMECPTSRVGLVTSHKDF